MLSLGNLQFCPSWIGFLIRKLQFRPANWRFHEKNINSEQVNWEPSCNGSFFNDKNDTQSRVWIGALWKHEMNIALNITSFLTVYLSMLFFFFDISYIFFIFPIYKRRRPRDFFYWENRIIHWHYLERQDKLNACQNKNANNRKC